MPPRTERHRGGRSRVARPEPGALAAEAGATPPAGGRARVVVSAVRPAVDGGRYPVKRVLGEGLTVEATAFADGHDLLRAQLLVAHASDEDWERVPMESVGVDRFRATVPVERLGAWRYDVRVWVDPFRTWRRDLEKRVAAGQDPALALETGARLVEDVRSASDEAARALAPWPERLRTGATAERVEAALAPELRDAVDEHAPPHHPTRGPQVLECWVEPELARSSAWYELFPRSAADEPGRHGTLRDVEARLDHVAALGFDILYLPPIHPIGRAYRKGPNNAVESEPGDPGSPWAIGAAEGGHTEVHPELGTLEDVRRLARAARERGIELALDVALQVSPDHPWVTEHPEWFRHRPDGSIQYAENPPKKYQDIYPLDFESEDWRGLWEACLGVFEHWVAQGVRVFRVDNPHTKSLHFWEWCVRRLKERHPEVILLSEAFTRPHVLHQLAKVGFTQSYTYFPWRNDKRGLTEYLTELTTTDAVEYLRPSQWTNTPDILPEYLQHGGRAAFQVRAVLAATLGASWGVYGPAFELLEDRPAKEGSEEYLDSEKYQLRAWDWDDPRSLRHLLTRLNRLRRENPALHQDRTLRFHTIENPQLLCYSKTCDDPANAVLVVVNLDPHHVQSGWVWLDLHALGLPNAETYQVHDLLSDARYLWTDEGNYVELDPAAMPAQVFRVRRRARTEGDFDYFA